MMKAIGYIKRLWTSQSKHKRLLCTNVATESIETDESIDGQRVKLTEPNLIDLDDDISYITSLTPIPHQSTSVDTGEHLCRNDHFWDSIQLTQSPLKWTKGELIGSGAYGKVYLGLNQETGQLMAVKEVQMPRDSCFQDRVAEHVSALEAEVDFLRRFSHHNIVQYLGTERSNGKLNIFLEYAAGGSVASLLSQFGPFEETLVRVFTRQILQGLEFLHRNKTAHRDIKGGNILVDHQGRVKLADFGASKSIENLATMNTGFTSLKGTPYWMAPEVIKQTGHGRQADIWSVGCTVIEMATGKPPWSDIANNVTVMFHIASSQGPPQIPSHFSHEARDFLKLCFNRNPKERPNATRLLQHPFVADVSHRNSSQAIDPFPPSSADDLVDQRPNTTSVIPASDGVNLVSEPSVELLLDMPDRRECQIDNSMQFDMFTREDLRNNAALLKAQWASELEKELRALKDMGKRG